MLDRRTATNEWLDLTTSGLAALAREDIGEAAELWLGTAGLEHHAVLPEPQKAAALNNAGVAHLINADPHEALACFKQARRHWAKAEKALEAEPMDAPAANSVFHLQLAMQHHDAFARLRREQSVRLCRTARAVTCFNRFTAMRGSIREEHLALLASALSETLGPRCAQLEIVAAHANSGARAACAAHAPYQHQLRSVMQLRERHPAAFVGDIEFAARLAVLVHPALIGAPAGTQCNEPTSEKD